MLAARTLSLTTLSAAAAACALAVAGCGSTQAPGGSGPGSPGTGSSASPGTGATTATCTHSDLRVSIDTAAAGVAAGSSLVPLEFRNVSGSPCTLPGFPAVSFAAGLSGPDIGAPAVELHSSSAPALTLKPGSVAHAWLQITDAANYPASVCKPVTASGLRVSFATSAGSAFVSRQLQACARRPHGSTILAVFPIEAGQARHGTAP